MAVFDQDQLEALRRQVEQDYRQDIAAIEHLQRRFARLSGTTPSNDFSLPADSASQYEPGSQVPPAEPSSAAQQSEELVTTLRSAYGSSPWGRRR